MAPLASGRRIVGEGLTSGPEWVDWLAALQPPLIEVDDVVKASERLVVVSPHPDDEVLACGGLIALHSQRQGSVRIVAVTDGEASHRGDPTWTAARLANARQAERESGLVHLGVASGCVTRLAMPDGRVQQEVADLTHTLRQTLRRTDCLVGTWRLDGHPDHDAVGTAAACAGRDVGCRLLEAPVWMWHWSWPGDPRVPWHRLRALTLPTHTLAGKSAAVAEHVTQLSARAGDAPVLGDAILARAARPAEYFFV